MATPPVQTNQDRWFKNIYQILQIQSGYLAAIAAGGISATNSTTFTIGDSGPNTPVNGSTTYTNTALISKSPIIFLNGFGTLVNGVDYTFNNTTGVVTLIGGRVFNTGEVYTILY